MCESGKTVDRNKLIKDVTMSGKAYCIKALRTWKKKGRLGGDGRGRRGGGARDEQLNLSNPFTGED